MTLSNLLALLGAMILLALIPGPSVFAVVARSLSSGFLHGLVTTIGIVVGDFVFILLAIYSLSAIATTMGSLFVLVKYLGGAFLIWLGMQLWRSQVKPVVVEEIPEVSWVANFLCGLVITLSDPKAILFYMSFFPAFVDLSRMTIVDTGMILLSAAIAVGGTKLAYAYLADRARKLFQNSTAKRRLNLVAGTVMLATGILLIAQH